jgi:hypothetical protein
MPPRNKREKFVRVTPVHTPEQPKEETKPPSVKVLETECAGEFANHCEDLLSRGYEMTAGNCGFAHSADHDFHHVYQAIFVRV